MRKRYWQVMSAVVLAGMLLAAGKASAQELTITSFKNGYLSWTNVNPNLYYTVEYRPNLSDTNLTWDGSHRVSQDVKSTNAIITVPMGLFYRVVGSPSPIHTRTLSPSSGTMAAGYYEAAPFTAMDTNLIAGNIRTNVTIFGVAGTLSTNGNAGTIYTRVIRLSGALDFGSVYTQAPKATNLTIWNDGDCAMTVTNIQYSDACFSGNWSGKVLAGSSTNITVTFAPVVAQGYSGTITVNGDPTSGTNTIACTGTGVVARYRDNGDGTATDVTTGLMWTKNANHGSMNYYDAVVYCDNLVTNGYSDWRLPSVNRQNGSNGPMDPAELDTLGWAGGIPGATPYARPDAPFTDVKAEYWSRTTLWGDGGKAHCVVTATGEVRDWRSGYTYKSEFHSVWPVRGGK